jgi:hypothetical protein
MPTEDPTSVENQTAIATEAAKKNPRRYQTFQGIAMNKLPGPVVTLVEYLQASGPTLIAVSGFFTLMAAVLQGFAGALKAAGEAGVAFKIEELTK